ncbi:MAG TPA: hypothetical protein VFA43_17945 [Gemmatimonadaceae bacterium]|nr:hypothetical protein [Gemmatimonadaceae bacterium]
MSASRWSTFALSGAAALALAACQSDNLTGVPANAKPESFQVTSANYAAARAATSNSKLFYQAAIADKKYLGQRSGISSNIVQSPWDLTWNGGPVVTHATQWNLYINCPTAPSCWSTGALTPRTFLRDYQGSSMAEILGQYTHVDPTGKFATVNELSATVKFAVDSTTGTPTMTGNDLLAILHAASAFTGKSGYDQIYHVFIPKGTDMCSAPGNCYSPDNFNTFVFCAFHGSADFDNHGGWHVLFTMEPYQFAPGCDAPNQPRVIDATASTLSHEFSELVTDPDIDAWINDLTGNEIGDLCFTFRNPEQLRSNNYVIQEEYSNTVHACTDGAF